MPSEDSDQPAHESSLDVFWLAKDAKFLKADNKDSYQTACIRRLICLLWAHVSEGRFSHVASRMTCYCLCAKRIKHKFRRHRQALSHVKVQSARQNYIIYVKYWDREARAKSAYPDQTPQTAPSDQGLQ